MKKLLWALPFVVPCSGTAVAAELTMGRWCDRMVPNMPKLYRELTIELKSTGQVVARSKFGDGSSLEQELTETSGNLFTVHESPSGDRYRIVPSSGDLQLFDEDGFIRSAERLENEPRPGDCLD